MSTVNIYYERQRGGLCRMHSLNAFFQKPIINEVIFNKYICEFDKQMKNKHGENISCKNFDLINSDQNNIVSFILKKYGFYAKYIPLNGVKKLPLNILKGNFIFIYNEKHIWGLIKKDNCWWNVDSLSGVRKTNINFIPKNTGFMIPVDMKDELYRNINNIKILVEKELITSKEDIKKYLIKLNKNKEILGDLEIYIGVSMDIIETQSLRKKRENIYKPIYKLLNFYNLFLLDFNKKNYSLDIILEYIPDIICELLKLCLNIILL